MPIRPIVLADAYLQPQVSLADQHCVVSFDWRALNGVRAARPDMAHAYTTLEFAATDPRMKAQLMTGACPSHSAGLGQRGAVV